MQVFYKHINCLHITITHIYVIHDRKVYETAIAPNTNHSQPLHWHQSYARIAGRKLIKPHSPMLGYAHPFIHWLMALPKTDKPLADKYIYVMGQKDPYIKPAKAFTEQQSIQKHLDNQKEAKRQTDGLNDRIAHIQSLPEQPQLTIKAYLRKRNLDRIKYEQRLNKPTAGVPKQA